MRILMVSAYPPVRDGIATYAVQSVGALRRSGHDVEVLSPFPSAAHHHLDLRTPRGAMQLAGIVSDYDKVIVQYHPDMFRRPTTRLYEREAIYAALALAWRRAKHVEIRVHEADYSRVHRGLTSFSTRAMWRAASHIVVHTTQERDAFHKSFGIPVSRIALEAHGRDFTPRTRLTRAEARQQLGVPADELMFLAIGFIQPHKGFDRAVRAFAALGDVRGVARLDIVGSVRIAEPEYQAYLDDLTQLAEATPGVHLHPEFVGDTEFDTWILASDALVLPYRHIWSSGVLERAALYQRTAIVTRVGGLIDQARSNTLLVDDDLELVDAMRKLVAEHMPQAPVAAAVTLGWPAQAVATRGSVTDVVKARAAMVRGTPSALVAPLPPAGRYGALASNGSPLRRLAPLELPAPVSRRPGAGLVKQVVRRLTGWELNPIVKQVNDLQRAMNAAIEHLQPENEAVTQEHRETVKD